MVDTARITELYFDSKLKQVDIAKQFNITKQYVSKIVRKDPRYTEEKRLRHNKSKQRKNEYNRNYFKSYARKDRKSTKDEDAAFEATLAKDRRLLSTKKQISKDNFVQSSIGAYIQDKNGNLVKNPKINSSYALPNTYKRNTQVLMWNQIYG